VAGSEAIPKKDGFCIFGVALSTNVYIDGFNLYYAIRKTNYKWLDLVALCSTLLPTRTINVIHYFTAIVKARDHDKSAPARQGVYLRALKTFQNVIVHDYGHFVDRPRLLPQFPYAYEKPNNPTKPPQAVQVMKTEEKGSDVNIASFLLSDCFDNNYDDAVIISNDADLTKPIEIVTTRYNKDVMVINPHRRKYLSYQLIRSATSYYPQINMGVYSRCQLPLTLSDSQGTITKPPTW
jgi:uncharacterized LabA/DUF88 family protein